MCENVGYAHFFSNIKKTSCRILNQLQEWEENRVDTWI